MSRPVVSRPVVLRRRLAARLFSGFWLQPFLTIAVALAVALTVLVTGPIGKGYPLAAVPGTVVLLILWGLGVTAYARVDERGVRWRYFRKHDLRWENVDVVRFGSMPIYGSRPRILRPAIFVRSGGIEHPIVPAYGCRKQARAEFAGAVAQWTARHAVQSEVDSSLWDGAVADASPAAHRGPGRVVSRSLQRVRLRLTGLAFVVVAVCGLIGAITGWEASGVGARIAFGVVGVLLGLTGVLLVARPGN